MEIMDENYLAERQGMSCSFCLDFREFMQIKEVERVIWIYLRIEISLFLKGIWEVEQLLY